MAASIRNVDVLVEYATYIYHCGPTGNGLRMNVSMIADEQKEEGARQGQICGLERQMVPGQHLFHVETHIARLVVVLVSWQRIVYSNGWHFHNGGLYICATSLISSHELSSDQYVATQLEKLLSVPMSSHLCMTCN